MANTRRKRMKINVSKLFAVTLFTPKRIVRNSLPCKDRQDTVFPERSVGNSGLCSLKAPRPASLSRKLQFLPKTMK